MRWRVADDRRAIGVSRAAGAIGRLRPDALALVLSSAVLMWFTATLVLGAVAQTPATCESCHTMGAYVENRGAAHVSLDCRDCHPSQGGLAVVGEGFGLQRWAVAELTGAMPRASAFDDAPCRECHEKVLLETTVTQGIRIRHVEVMERPCLDCHGGTGHALQGRLYGTTLMEECTECHSASPTDPETCDLCHSPGSSRGRAKPTTWRATHGPNWRQTHGMGDLGTCVTCHEPQRCASCHGVSLPHPMRWDRSHGDKLDAEGRRACETCHESQWCEDCHGGVSMPHEDAYIMMHQFDAESRPAVCSRCHVSESCDDCHRLAGHPDVEGVAGHDIEAVGGR